MKFWNKTKISDFPKFIAINQNSNTHLNCVGLLLPCSQDIHILEGCHKDIMIQFQSLTINRLIIVRYIGWWYYYCYILWDESLNSKHSITAPASQLSQPARRNWNWEKIGNSAKLKHFLFDFQSSSTFICERFLSEGWRCSMVDCVRAVLCFIFPWFYIQSGANAYIHLPFYEVKCWFSRGHFTSLEHYHTSAYPKIFNH